MNIKEVIINPVLTEKATNLTKDKVYMFNVSLNANKSKIKTVLEKIYKVKVASVGIMIRKGKKRRLGRRMVEKKLSDRKIAFVKLKEGKIDLFPQA
ncbi:50S ribosomal protein L23 [Patescibacteria group bacterium]|nr:50S ribosomal protein L23 [Patescibacteria group bacterium]